MVREILNIIYQIIIGPLRLLFEFVFARSYKIVNDPGICIIILSIVMNLLALPLYRRADILQREAAENQKAAAPWQERIRKTFKGDERFMMLRALNREQGMKPTDALKGSVSLLLEIPFFIAAYKMLSSLSLLNGKSFGPIKDLGAPDGLLVIGGIAVNLLPILMTLINIISSSIYTKGSGLSSKIQLYGIAGIFLVLLYNSPSGLVFYWTCNNIFSLIKNLIPAGADKKAEEKSDTSRSDLIFLLCGIYNSILVGLMIPSALIGSSTAEFVDMYHMVSPAVYLIFSAALSLGTFLLWPKVFYSLSSSRAKKVFAVIAVALSVLFTADYAIFGKEYGTMSPALFYRVMNYSVEDTLVLGITVIALIGVLVFVLRKYITAAAPLIVLAGILSVTVVSISSIAGISSNYKALSYLSDQQDYATLELTSEGENVVVIMLDRACGYIVPYCFNERPELEEQFSGFTFYPNTLSFGAHTNIAAPALYGGYDYTPMSLNARAEEPLSAKHDEALKVLPVLFLDNGFDVTVCDPSYAGYQEIPDLSVFDDYPEIRTFITNGRFNGMKDREFSELTSMWERNFFCYGFFRVMPPFLHGLFYDDGHYNIPGFYGEYQFVPISTGSGNQAKGYDPEFMDAYSVLESLPQMTEISDSGTGSYTLLVNYTTHTEAILREPDYVPEFYVDNTEYDRDNADRFDEGDFTLNWQLSAYQDTMAAFIKLGEWFDYLRDLGIYDNTRIIIVSDHGNDLYVNDPMIGDGITAEFYNPILMVKDFDAEGFEVCEDLATNADVPYLAVEGLMEDPVNPFTGNPIIRNTDYDEPLYVFASHECYITSNNGNTFLPGPWYIVRDDMRDIGNWESAEQ